MNNIVRLLYLQSKKKVADLFTKIVGLPKIHHFIQLMNNLGEERHLRAKDTFLCFGYLSVKVFMYYARY